MNHTPFPVDTRSHTAPHGDALLHKVEPVDRWLNEDEIRLAESFNATRPRRTDFNGAVFGKDVIEYEHALRLWLNGLSLVIEAHDFSPENRSEFASRAGYAVVIGALR